MKKLLLILSVFLCYFSYSQTSPTYENITIRNEAKVRQKLYLIPTISAPATALEGMMYADTDHYLYYYNGTAWIPAVSMWTPTGATISNNNAGDVNVSTELHAADSAVFSDGVKFNDTVNVNVTATPSFNEGDPTSGVFAPRRQGASSNRQLAIMTFIELYNAMMDTVQDAPTPSAFGQWERDTTLKRLSPIHTEDTVYVLREPGQTGVHVVIHDTASQDFSTNTGTDTELTHAYEAFKFTATKTENINAIRINLKKTGTITNTTAAIQGWIYSDAAGEPDTAISFIAGSFKIGAITASYTEFTHNTGTVSLTSGTPYWLVLTRSAAPTGGSIFIDTKNTGTALYASSTDGTTWTPANNITVNLKLFNDEKPALNVEAQNFYGIKTHSNSEYGIFTSSVFDQAIRGEGVHFGAAHFQTVYGNGSSDISYWGPGTGGYSTKNYGGFFSSIDSIGMFAQSPVREGVYGYSESLTNYAIKAEGVYGGMHGYATGGYGIFGQTTNAGYAGVLGQSSGGTGIIGNSYSNYGVQAQSGTNYGLFALSPEATKGAALFYSYPSTDNLQQVIRVQRDGDTVAGMGCSIDYNILEVYTARIGSQIQRYSNFAVRAGDLSFYTLGPDGLLERATIDSAGYGIFPFGMQVGQDKQPAYTLDVTGEGHFTDDLWIDDTARFVGTGNILTSGNGNLNLNTGSGAVVLSGDLNMNNNNIDAADTINGAIYYGATNIGNYYASWSKDTTTFAVCMPTTAIITGASKALYLVGPAGYSYSYSNGITVPTDSVITFPTAGRYAISITGLMPAGTSINIRYSLVKNDATVLSTATLKTGSSTTPFQTSISTIANITANDYIELKGISLGTDQTVSTYSISINIYRIQ